MAEIADECLFAAVSSYASAVTGCPSERITAVKRFADGNRHAVHRVSYLDAANVTQDVVVRVSFGGEAADLAQAEREAAALKAVAGVAGPVLYDFRRTSPWFDTPAMCMQFLPGRHRKLNSTTPQELARLAVIVAWVHDRPTDDLIEPLHASGNVASYAHDRLQSITSTLTWARDPLPAPLQAHLRQAASRLAASLEDAQHAECFRTGEPVRLLHGDVAGGNILWGRAPVLIDWEYARLGDPADEIAYLFDQNALSKPQRDAFLERYQQTVPSATRLDQLVERISWWEPMTLLGSALWWVERWVRRTELDAVGATDHSVPRDAGHYFDHITRRVARLQKLVALP
jgi:aminoglycoside phosphotransferase (APT) family kinase protein